ncbi:phosphatase PAP2 family protein [Streptomyces sp. RB6PN25]|uniref:Phosphatase PAP2 family protein n=1 Tax=Streptomyces humicola TaxID=2953240 RepID=A0ABT1Q5G3_9ACTN|nr:phosphatase PAP2 family protein [Streptomyces humicola]MCQ4084565.1 phosphatase PAP2 family protein [Streptomyces humicola]
MTVVGACALLLALLTWQVAVHGPLFHSDTGVDSAVLQAAARYRFLTPAAQFLADLGDIQVAVPALAAALGYAAWYRRRAGHARWWLPSACCALVMALVGPVIVPLKDLVSRPAPGSTVLLGHSGYFPSGHASTAAMACGLALLATLPLLRSTSARRLLVAAAVLLNGAVGAGLVWRGYHWPLDVAAAWCLSGVLLGLTRWWGSPG